MDLDFNVDIETHNKPDTLSVMEINKLHQKNKTINKQSNS